VYATGRSLERFRAAQNEDGLPDADGLIASAGTEIYIGENYQALYGWPQTFKAGWDRAGIVAAAKIESLTLQPASEQRPYKLSFSGRAGQSADLQKFHAGLTEICPTAELLVSHGGEFIDIVPRASDKGAAVCYLAKKWSIPPKNIIAAGDSANDIAMLSSSKAIVVGNAYGEVREWFAGHSELPVYFAKANFAEGISEGLDYFLGQNWGKV
ncbi:MAG: HAD family hydrolase, partial [Candidatus Saccharimonadales bacterium]